MSLLKSGSIGECRCVIERRGRGWPGHWGEHEPPTSAGRGASIAGSGEGRYRNEDSPHRLHGLRPGSRSNGGGEAAAGGEDSPPSPLRPSDQLGRRRSQRSCLPSTGSGRLKCRRGSEKWSPMCAYVSGALISAGRDTRPEPGTMLLLKPEHRATEACSTITAIDRRSYVKRTHPRRPLATIQ